MKFEMVNVLIRTTISVVILFIIGRIMGKKQISHLTIFDYIVGITIGSVAGTFAVDSTINIFHGILTLCVLGASSLLISLFSIKSIYARRILGSVPAILIRNGKIIEKNLIKEKFSVNDLLEELRIKGAFNIADVEFAVLETNGQVSVLLKSQHQPVTPEDLNIPSDYKGISANIIIDGKIMHENLKLLKLDESWLKGELDKRNINSVGEIFLASMDTGGNLYIDLKEKAAEHIKVIE